MAQISYKGETAGTTSRVNGHVDVLDATKLAEYTKECIARYLEVDVVDKDFGEGAQILMAGAVGWLLFVDRIS